jgi:hypothetical protein
METIFQISSIMMGPFWLLMILAPHWHWTRRIVGSLWSVVPPALLYTILIIPVIPATLPLLANPTLDQFLPVFSTPEGVTLGWIHFITSDYFVGRWAYLDSRARRLTAWLVSPVILIILLFGPLGLLLYLGVRAALGNRGAAAATL